MKELQTQKVELARFTLGIETSCDETAVAVVSNGRELLSNQIHSQIADHAPFHGVVPEIASRAHLEKIGGLLDAALRESGLGIEDCGLVAVSTHPGLVGSLMIGGLMAQSIRLVHGTPIVAVNHLEAHLYAPCLEGFEPEYPFLGLLLSGGNSPIFIVRGPGKMERIADTMDDAIGEAFDKASSLMGLGYPGGPVVEKMAKDYAQARNLPLRFDEEHSLFPRLLKNQPRSELAFSFSGIKTAVRHAVRKQEHPTGRIALDFQNTVFELVARVLVRAVRKTRIRTVVAAGGVLANQTLRDTLQETARQEGFRLIHPQSRVLSTDNAAMVAALGARLWISGAGDAGFGFEVHSKAN